jgi:type II secretory ATPase GspE/PulE/Tfp pilus assembly ATPase PilB-like protein
MKVEPFLAASTVNIAIGQRLVRKICPDCKKSHLLSVLEKNRIKTVIGDKATDNTNFWRGEGCEHCNGTGYLGRLGIHEVLVVDNDIREAILARSSSSEIKKIAINNGMTTLVEDGIAKAKEGLTTIEEIIRILYE